MKRSYLLYCVGALLLSASASAQNASDVLRFSRYNYGFGTARSAAMGGAFGSLGADLSSASINPAGMGMYRKSEFGISPSIMLARQNSTYENGDIRILTDDNRSRFALNNVGFAMNVYNGLGNLTSITLGFTYNKLADFNNHSYTRGHAGTSLADVFENQLNSNNIDPNTLDSPSSNVYQAFDRYPTSLWGAIMGYQSFLLDYDNGYTLSGILSDGVNLNSGLRNDTKGSIGEYNISGGLNISDFFYFGISIGLQDISYDQWKTYEEFPIANAGSLAQLSYRESLKMNGSAVNVKFGVIARPIAGLRLGVAFHTPSYIDIKEEFKSHLKTYFSNNTPGESDTPYLLNNYNMQTPSRLILSGSYTFGKWGIISVDYDRVWYNKMFLESGDDNLLEQDTKDEVRATYQAANNFRIGGEITPIPGWFLRAGYGYYGSMFKTGSDFGKTENISAGVGYRGKFFYTDIAYVHMKTTNPTEAMIANGNQWIGGIRSERLQNNVTLSLGFRF